MLSWCRQTDGQTDRQTDWQWWSNMPPIFWCGGIKINLGQKMKRNPAKKMDASWQKYLGLCSNINAQGKGWLQVNRGFCWKKKRRFKCRLVQIASIRRLHFIYLCSLTLSQMTDFRLFQNDIVCRQQFQIWQKWLKILQMGWLVGCIGV